MTPGGAARALPGALASRPLHVVLFAGVAGLLAGPHVAPAGLAGSLAVLVVGDGVAQAAAGGRSQGPGLRARRWLPAALAGAVVLGAAVAGARLEALEATRLGPRLGHAFQGRVVLQDAPRPSRFGGWSATAELDGEPVLLRVAGRRDPPRAAGEPVTDAPPGAVLAVTGRLRAPGAFADGRHAHAELLTAAPPSAVGRRGGAAGALDRVRTAAQRALDSGLPPAAAGLFQGMVLGQDAAMPTATRDAFRAAGLSHLVAASGTNVVLLATLAAAVGSLAGLGLTGRLWLVLGLIALYVPLAGGGPSIQRAGIMGAAAVVAGLVGRPASRSWALGLAALVTLVLDPRAAQDPGWQLSFVAVLGILALAGRWRAGLAARGVPGPLAEAAALTGAATLATAPVIAAHFGQASLVALPANLLAAPVVAPVMWLGVASATLGQAAAGPGPVAALAVHATQGLDALAGFGLGYLIWLAGTGAALPGAVLHVGPWPVLGACAALAVALCSRRGRRLSPLAALAAVALVLGLDSARAGPPGAPAGLRVTALDVGQGDATLLQHRERTVLVDAGPPDGGIVRRLRDAGVGRLDALVVTHAQADHLGGAAAVLAAVPVGAVLDGRDGVPSPAGDAMGRVAAARRVPLLAPRAGQVLTIGALRLRVLWPPARPSSQHAGEDPNQRAVVLEAAAGGARVLLTADAESDVLGRLDLRPVDVLKVAHHGSADPGLPALLARLRPRVAAIEVGARNTYGHPAPATLRALEGVPAVVRTDRDGTVRLDHLGPGRWELRGLRGAP